MADLEKKVNPCFRAGRHDEHEWIGFLHPHTRYLCDGLGFERSPHAGRATKFTPAGSNEWSAAESELASYLASARGLIVESVREYKRKFHKPPNAIMVPSRYSEAAWGSTFLGLMVIVSVLDDLPDLDARLPRVHTLVIPPGLTRWLGRDERPHPA